MSTITHADLDAAIAALGLTYEASFVPQSMSRNAGETHRSLNWKIRIGREGSKVTIVTDYMQGIGHVPGYPQSLPKTLYFEPLWKDYDGASESGKYPHEPLAKHVHEHGTRLDIRHGYQMRQLPKPELRDVLYSLVSDSDAADSTFEDWASDLGYDTDSRKAEAMYRACLDIGSRLRSLIGSAALEQLRELFRDY